jgi:hypothetical protein
MATVRMQQFCEKVCPQLTDEIDPINQYPPALPSASELAEILAVTREERQRNRITTGRSV